MDGMALGPRVLCAAAAFVLCAAARGAQDQRLFDAEKELDGYREALWSPWSDLYRFEEFQARSGKHLDEATIAEIAARWSAESARAQDEIAATVADPRRWFLHDAGRALAEHAYFSKVELTFVDGPAPFAFWVQAPRREDPGYAERVTAALVPVLEEARARYDRALEPLGLARRVDHGALAVIVLASHGDYDDFRKLSPAQTHGGSPFVYDSKLRAAVLYEDPFGSGPTRDERERAVRHALAHVLQQSTYAGGERVPVENWLAEGLALWLEQPLERAGNASTAVQDRGRPSEPARDQPLTAVDAQALELLVGAACAAAAADRVYFLRPLPGLFKAATLREIGPPHRERWPYEPGLSTRAWFAEAGLLAGWMLERAGPARRDELLAAVARLARLPFTASSEERALPAETLAELESEFRDWLVAEHRRQRPTLDFDIQAVLDAGASPEPTAAEAGGPPSRPELRLDATAPELALALACRQASVGRTSLALAVLDAALAAAPPGDSTGPTEPVERIVAERGRIAAWAELRDLWLASFVGSTETLAIERDGEIHRLKITALSNGELRFAAHKSRIKVLEVEALDPHELAKQMARVAPIAGPTWARFVPYALAGDERWRTQLEGDSPEIEALRAVAPELPALVHRGRCVELLAALDAAPWPPTAEAAETLIEEAREILRNYATDALVIERQQAVRALAAAAFASRFDAQGPIAALRGASEDLGDGRLRVTYGFDAPEELDDFRPLELADLRARFEGTELHGPLTGAFRTEGGILTGTGHLAIAHALEFSGAFKATWELSFPFAKSGGGQSSLVAVGAALDARELYVWAPNFGDLEMRDEQGFHGEIKSGLLTAGKLRTVELAFDGESWTSFLNGEQKQQLACSSRKSGKVFVFAHGDLPVQIGKLVLEGTPTPESLVKLRADWAARQAAAL